MDNIKKESRIPTFYTLSVPERVRAVRDRGLISPKDYDILVSGEHTLKVQDADRMIENVIGVMGLPVGLALNFLINGRDWVIPMVVEEPSIVAALGSAAKMARLSGGFEAQATEPILIGQVQVMSVEDTQSARLALLENRQDILNLANGLHPRMVARGGGAKDIEVHVYDTESGPMLILHLLVDTRDAMGANLVNTMCEGIASLVEQITGGEAFLRILSNLADRCLVRARMTIPVANLTSKEFQGEKVRDGIISAYHFAAADPYRATTHNKGIMNGVDAVAIATGNDWRSIEAAAHAYAARDGRYTSLTRFAADEAGNLTGEIEMPMKVGIVGGSLESNPTVALNLRLLGAKSAMELAMVMGCVGLAQNFAALRALATEGIQQGHMNLHARSVASAAGVPLQLFDLVVERLVECNEIKVWKAKEIVAELSAPIAAPAATAVNTSNMSTGCGKVILLGEHAVVYGRRALAAPIPLAVAARASKPEYSGIELIIPRWGVEQRLLHDTENHPPQGYQQPLKTILEYLELTGRDLRIELFPNIPRAMGLGGSSALAVAVVRALDQHFRLGLSDEEVNELAYQCERVAHGTPSGVDNTVATYGQFIQFHRPNPEDEAQILPVRVAKPLPVVIGLTGVESLTVTSVGRVRNAWLRNAGRYEHIFDQIDELVNHGVEAVQTGDLEELGEIMNICQGYLNALQVSGPEIEELVQIARDAGAFGAKLTGGGVGGSVVALCKENDSGVAEAMRAAGYEALEFYLE